MTQLPSSLPFPSPFPSFPLPFPHLHLTSVETIQQGGNVLIPVDVGETMFDLMEMISAQLKYVGYNQKSFHYISTVSLETLALAGIYGEWLNPGYQSYLYKPCPPMSVSRDVASSTLLYHDHLQSVLQHPGPHIVFAGHSSLRGGNVALLFDRWKNDPNSCLLLTGKQIQNSCAFKFNHDPPSFRPFFIFAFLVLDWILKTHPFLDPFISHESIFALYSPILCSVHWIPFDPRLSFSSCSTLLKSKKFGHLILPKAYDPGERKTFKSTSESNLAFLNSSLASNLTPFAELSLPNSVTTHFLEEGLRAPLEILNVQDSDCNISLDIPVRED